jgi:predicted ferric reductase
MTLFGPTITVLAVLVGAVLGARTYLPYGTETALAIAFGAASITAMSLALILAARPRPLEPFFGGLDRMYGVHKWLGIAALTLMIGHNMVEPEIEDFVGETSLGEFASDLGEFALNGFIGLILVSWFKRIPFTRLELPWPIWRFTHRFTGLLFAIAAFHQLAIDKPTGIDATLGWYLNTFSVVGMAAWLFTQLVAPHLRRQVHVLDDIERHGSVTEITLRPEVRGMRWRPGQFAFVSAPDAGLAEAHPFTITAAPGADGRLRFGIKALGDWTTRLSEQLPVGGRLSIDGPYGRFFFRRRVNKQVWLAGGIGITPFLAWAEALTDADLQEIALIWAVTKPADAFAADRLAAIAARHSGLTFHVVVGETEGRLTAERLASLVPFTVGEAELFFCGPSEMRETIVAGLRARGVSPRRVHHEAFEFR